MWLARAAAVAGEGTHVREDEQNVRLLRALRGGGGGEGQPEGSGEHAVAETTLPASQPALPVTVRVTVACRAA